MSSCRNCKSTDLKDLGFVGELAPFFLKRVFNIQLDYRIAFTPVREMIRKLAIPARPFFSKLYGRSAFIEMQICRDCSFVQARHGFAEEAIGRLYVDYRAETYNTERIKYEPSYKEIATRVGSDPHEVKTRVDAVTTWLRDKIDYTGDFTMLDYGGADGRFLPEVPVKKFVYEISNIEPLEGITRVASEADLETYSYIHLAHVLEHVVEPLKLVSRLTQWMKISGYLYLEVPQEMTDADLELLKRGAYPLNITIHEHINKYSVPTLTRLIQEAGLELVAIRADHINVGWGQAIHLRALGRKP